jgi:Protein of unknown function (DUF2971)
MESPTGFSFSGTPVTESVPTPPTVMPPPTAVVPNDAGTVRYEHFDDRFLRWGDERDQHNWELAFSVLREPGELEDDVCPPFPGRNELRPQSSAHHELFLYKDSQTPSESHWVFSSSSKERRTYEFLFHYTGVETLGHLAKSGMLRLGPLETMNDPRESKPWDFSTMALAGEGAPSDEEVAQAKKDARTIRLNSKLACFIKEPPLPEESFHDRWETRPRGFLMPRMWSQYGQSHAGVCLIFDRSKLQDCFDSFLVSDLPRGWFSGFCGDVKYTNDSSENGPASWLRFGSGESVQQQFERSREQHFLTKHPDWEGEGEFRLVVMTAEEGPLYFDVTGAVVGLILGENFGHWADPIVSEFVKTFAINANVAKASWTGWTSSVDLIDY